MKFEKVIIFSIEKSLLAKRLVELLKARGLSRKQITELTGLSPKGQRLIESGTTNVTDESRLRYLEALGISLFEFHNCDYFMQPVKNVIGNTVSKANPKE